eukprot:29089-Pelagococcus_subviridis.AAC.5
MRLFASGAFCAFHPPSGSTFDRDPFQLLTDERIFSSSRSRSLPRLRSPSRSLPPLLLRAARGRRRVRLPDAPRRVLRHPLLPEPSHRPLPRRLRVDDWRVSEVVPRRVAVEVSVDEKHPHRERVQFELLPEDAPDALADAPERVHEPPAGELELGEERRDA